MTIYGDFIAIQQKLPPLVKDTQGDGYKYPTLNQLLDIVLPMCHDRGLGLMQVTHPVEGGVGVETVLFNDKNERISSGVLAMPLTTDGDGNIINVGGVKRSGGVYGQFGAQAYGSALTYARRYSLTAFFGMKAEDDDGFQASQRHQKQPAFNVFGAIDALRNAPDFKSLKAVFVDSWRQANDKEKAQLKAVYDDIKRILEQAKKE